MSAIAVTRVERLKLSVVPRPWPFADVCRAQIDAHFEELRREKPALVNGRILLMHDHAVAGKIFRGSFFETDYASFLAWRDWGFPDGAVADCFALAALRASA